VGFSVAGYVASTILLPKNPLKDEFIQVYIIASVGLMIGSLAGYALAQNKMGDD